MIRVLPASELEVLIKKHNEAEAKLEAEKKKAEKSSWIGMSIRMDVIIIRGDTVKA